MGLPTIVENFKKMGARVKIFNEIRPAARPFSIDIRNDKDGEYFDLRIKKEIEMMVLDTQKKDRHLLLLTRNHAQKDRSNRPDLMRFLCGHDERHWFVSAIPGNATSVFNAKEALKPDALRRIESIEGIKHSEAQKRHRKLESGIKVHRQGEFMFVPVKDFKIPDWLVLKDEPMRRGNFGNAHMAQFLYREGGQTVYTSAYNEKSRNVGLTEGEYQRAMHTDKRHASVFAWRREVRNPTVYAKGRITHRDHKTLDFGNVWHRVMINTESVAKGAIHVAFID